MATKELDGFTVAKEVELEDRFESGPHPVTGAGMGI